MNTRKYDFVLRKKIFESPKTHYSFRAIFWWSSIAAMLIISLCLNFAADGIAKDTAKLLGPPQTQWTPEAEEAAKLKAAKDQMYSIDLVNEELVPNQGVAYPRWLFRSARNCHRSRYRTQKPAWTDYAHCSATGSHAASDRWGRW